MEEPNTHTVIIHAGFDRDVNAPVIYVKDLGDKRALVHLETKLHIEDGRDLRATYSTGSHQALGKYRLSAKVFTAAQTYIYMGVFTRE
jgi:hypothetical protein